MKNKKIIILLLSICFAYPGCLPKETQKPVKIQIKEQTQVEKRREKIKKDDEKARTEFNRMQDIQIKNDIIAGKKTAKAIKKLESNPETKPFLLAYLADKDISENTFILQNIIYVLPTPVENLEENVIKLKELWTESQGNTNLISIQSLPDKVIISESKKINSPGKLIESKTKIVTISKEGLKYLPKEG